MQRNNRHKNSTVLSVQTTKTKTQGGEKATQKKKEKKEENKQTNNKKPTQTFGQKAFCFSFLSFKFIFIFRTSKTHMAPQALQTQHQETDFTACSHQQSIIYKTDVSSFCALTLKFFRVLKY